MRGFTALLILIPFTLSSSAHAEQSSAADIAGRLGLSSAAIERVKKGEVVAEGLDASSDKDLSLAVVMLLDAPPGVVFDFVDADRMAEYQTVTISEGEIDPANPSLAALELPADVLDQLFDDPEGTFFLSAAEAKQVAAAAKKGKAQLLDAYRAVLAARAKVYWEKGLAGIASYAGKNRSPKDDLTQANGVAKALVKNAVFRAELEAAPSKSPGKATHRLSWAVEKGRDQAAPVLIHQILYREGNADLFLERRFYSGYDYDALQILVGILPIEGERSVVFYTNHTYTAQVAGFGGSAKRSIGRKLLEKELVAEMQRAQKITSAR